MKATNGARADLSILLVEDDADFRSQLIKLLGVFNTITEAGTLAQARKALDQGQFDVVLLDKSLPDGSGLDLIPEIKSRNFATAVIVFTGDSNFNLVQKCLESGASDYLIKSEHAVSDLLVRIPMALSRIALEQQSRELSTQLKGAFKHEIVGNSPQATELRTQVESLKGSQSPILILGESGTGKELVARRLNAIEDKASRPFIAVNCGALPTQLLESELFGHKKGAFTGAAEDKIGAFALANGGDLFLDEIGELPIEAQVKLLRALQEGEVTPIGSFTPVPVSVRIIAATHRPLEDLVREGRFREDLYYRLNVYRIQTPALRSRVEDIPDLASFFLAQLGAPGLTLTDAAKSILKRQIWPGNIRELRNTIERALLESRRTQSKVIHADHIQVLGSVTAVNAHGLRIPNSLEEASPEGYADFVARSEAAYIQAVLTLCGGSVALAARQLGLNRTTLYRKLGAPPSPGLKTGLASMNSEVSLGH